MNKITKPDILHDDNNIDLVDLKNQTLADIDQAVRIINIPDSKKWHEYLLIIMWIPIEEIITCYVWMGNSDDSSLSKAAWNSKSAYEKVKYLYDRPHDAKPEIMEEDLIFFDELRQLRDAVSKRYITDKQALLEKKSEKKHFRGRWVGFYKFLHAINAFIKTIDKNSRIYSFNNLLPSISLSDYYKSDHTDEYKKEEFQWIYSHIYSSGLETIPLISVMHSVAEDYITQILIKEGYAIEHHDPEHSGRIVITETSGNNTCKAKVTSVIDFLSSSLETPSGQKSETDILRYHPRTLERTTIEGFLTFRKLRNCMMHSLQINEEYMNDAIGVWMVIMCGYYFTDTDGENEILRQMRLFQTRNNFMEELSDLKTLIDNQHKFAAENLGTVTVEMDYALQMIKDIERERHQYASLKYRDASINEDDALELFSNNILEKAQGYYEKSLRSTYMLKAEWDVEEALGKDKSNLLTDDERRFLVTGYLLAEQTKRFGESIDFSGPVIEFTKALERILHRIIWKPAKKSIGHWQNAELVDKINQDNMTLGSYEFLIKDDYFYTFRDAANLPDIDWRGSVLATIDDVRKQIRNMASHKDRVSQKALDDCIKKLTKGENSLIYQLL
ncbi:hypothetical protein ACTQZS_07320 [Bilifractor sp. LCP19S3_H10]|uniref:hypothetical protein n=1 Tax=Bilifractor sp. LCP19S3_H10 TaxID=3438736 RepID=UPI003F93DB39